MTARGIPAVIRYSQYPIPVNPMMVTTGGTKGPMYKPVAPAPCIITPRVLGVTPRLATMGMRIGAIIAFEPARVPSMLTNPVDVSIAIKIACFFDLSLALPTT
ncbi:hypothetical protein SDC9_132109 [bioreactor metagenome]|uniref:Uncharacterized protein n=1 Tax=bioreactor metagenome TaxID=1076179 RepID=A0A645D8U2_9ZZZZ